MEAIQLYYPPEVEESKSSPYVPQTMEDALKYVIQNYESNMMKGQRLNSLELERFLQKHLIFHLPEYLYQIMFNTAIVNMEAGTPENGKFWIKEQLMQHLKDSHEGYELQEFIDLRHDEARSIHPNMGWGMWYKLIAPKRNLLEEIDHEYRKYNQVTNNLQHLLDDSRRASDVNE